MTMSAAIEEVVIEVLPREPSEEAKPPRVELLDGRLCTEVELKAAVIASGIVCAIAGFGLGYLMGREGRR